MEETGLSVEVGSVETEISAPAVIESGSSTEISTSSGGDSAPAISGEVIPYTPNYKVKAYDAEYEIPATYHSFINEKNEKEFKQLFSKAYGLDVMQGKNTKLREQNTALEKIVNEKYLPLYNGLEIANKYIANQDFGSLFEMLKIPVANVQGWMLRELQMKDLPVEQQEIYNRNSTTQKQLYQLEQLAEKQAQELSSIKEATTQAQVVQRANELDKVLDRPDVKAAVSRFDTRLNKIGAFKDEVIQRAQFIAQTKGQDLSAEQAVQEFMKLIATDTPSANPNQTVIAAKSGSNNPTLPNLTGQTTSPAAQKVKSMADLYALKKQAIASMSENQ